MKIKNAYIALFILLFVTISISYYEFITAINNFNPNGNVFDFCSGAVEYVPYCMIFLLVLFAVLPIALLLFKENNISIKDAIYKKEFLFKDIIYGIILGIVSALIAYPFTLIRDLGSKYDHIIHYDSSIWLYILLFISLTIVCGILKELYFRGFSKYFLKDVLGEKASIVLTSILFGIVDWQNMGSSVILGLLWGYTYKKNDRLIIPMIAHGLINAIGIIWLIIF